jgi:GTP-binding protein LepA
VSKEVINLLGCDESDIIQISAKTGENVDQVLEAIIERVPPPVSPLTSSLLQDSSSVKGSPFDKESALRVPTRALIFDSYYDDYRGVILYLRVVDGTIKKSDAIKMLATSANGIALEVGHLAPTMSPDPELSTWRNWLYGHKSQDNS